MLLLLPHVFRYWQHLSIIHILLDKKWINFLGFARDKLHNFISTSAFRHIDTKNTNNRDTQNDNCIYRSIFVSILSQFEAKSSTLIYQIYRLSNRVSFTQPLFFSVILCSANNKSKAILLLLLSPEASKIYTDEYHSRLNSLYTFPLTHAAFTSFIHYINSLSSKAWFEIADRIPTVQHICRKVNCLKRSQGVSTKKFF